MSARVLLILLCVSGSALIWWGLKPQPAIRSQVEIANVVSEESQGTETPSQPPNTIDERLPIKGEPPPQSPAATTADTKKKEEPFMRHYPEDSPKKIGELRDMFASTKNLNATLKMAKPISGWKYAGVIDSGVYKLSDGGLASFRRFWQLGEDGKFTSDSCYSLRMPGQEPIVGQFSDGTLTMLELPEPYSHIYVLRGKYFFMDVIEYSRWRAEIREPNPSIENLYKKMPSGETLLIGEWFRASVDGVPTSDAFEMPPRQYCETVPVPTAD